MIKNYSQKNLTRSSLKETIGFACTFCLFVERSYVSKKNYTASCDLLFILIERRQHEFILLFLVSVL